MLNFVEDGPCDMVVAYSDRIVRLFKWIPNERSETEFGKLVLLIKWELAGQVIMYILHSCFQISRISLHSISKKSNLVSFP